MIWCNYTINMVVENHICSAAMHVCTPTYVCVPRLNTYYLVATFYGRLQRLVFFHDYKLLCHLTFHNIIPHGAMYASKHY